MVETRGFYSPISMKAIVNLLLAAAVLIVAIKILALVVGAVWSIFLVMATFICVCAVIGGSDSE